MLGLLVGLQRQRAAPGMPGLRTFPLITVFGTVAAVLSGPLGGWVVAAGLLGLTAIVVAAALQRDPDDFDRGTTTEVSALVMYGVGALLAFGHTAVAVAIGGGVAVLLEFKPQLHGFARQLGDRDLKAIMQFVLITCIILPVLPRRSFGPLDVLNPFETWLMVVFIVGLSLSGYVVYKFFGREAGILLGGLLGGAVSSTATTVTYARQARETPQALPSVTIVILIASAVSLLRVLVAVTVVSPNFACSVAGPVAVMLALTILPSLVLWYRVERESAPPTTGPQNPTHLRSAIVFGAMYSLVLFGLAAAKQYLGGRGLMAMAAVSGLTDMDAITLSTARMSLADSTVADSGWRLIIAAAMANLVAKTLLAGALGGRALFWRVGLLLLLPMLGGAATLFFWPAWPV